MKNILLWAGAIGCALWCIWPDSAMESPQEDLSVSVEQVDNKTVFKVSSEDDEFASLSLGLKLANDELCFNSDESVYIEKVSEVNDYNEYILSQGSEKLKIRFRLYDDAVAFRYESHDTVASHVKTELSTWTLPAESTIWYFERKNTWKLKSYAGTWEKASFAQLTTVASSPVQGTPIVFQLPSGNYGFIAEAGLENYSGLRLEVTDEHTFAANFTEGEKGFDVSACFTSPWRILFVGNDLNALVNQQIVKELAPQPDSKLYADRSYIQPGKCAWRWFAKGTGTPEEEQQVIDEASQLHFLYSLVDDGWKAWPDCWQQAENLVTYAKKKGVRLLFWQHSMPLRNPTNDYEGMRSFLDSIAGIGAAGVKVDFMDSEAKRLIDFEIKLLKECAKRQLIVNFHGCQAPAGETYTYPNELTREGIRGIELNKMREGYIPSYHNAALPFTRLMVGHGDYTPLTFTVPGETSFAHQLATLVCFNSPLQTIAEDPGLLLHDEHVNSAAGFIRDVPTVWDEVRVLPQSDIAKLAVIAKRKGCNWYIGVLNGEAKVKDVTLDLAPFVGHYATVEAYVDDVKADRVLLPMDGHRRGPLKREPSVPFKVVKDLNALKDITLAAHGGAVVVLHNELDNIIKISDDYQ